MPTFGSLKLCCVAVVSLMGLGSSAYSQDKLLRRELSVEWTQAKADSAGAEERDENLAGFKKRYAGEIAATRLPVLVPNSAAVNSELRLASQGSNYVVESKLEAAVLTLFGNITALGSSENQIMSNAASGCKDRFEPADDGMDLNFCKYNAAYVLRLTCDDIEDSRCRKEDFLNRVKQGLLVAGGEKLQ